MDTSESIIVGRPFGGLAVMWRKTLGSYCKPITYDDEVRIMGLEISSESTRLLILNFYMPFCSSDNFDDFVFYLNKLNSFVSNADTPLVYAIGDFNADIVKKHNLFGKELVKFCQEEGFIISDNICLPEETYTFHSEAHGSKSWLDHIICTNSAHSLVCDVNVCYNYVTSDHVPLCFNINLQYSVYNTMSEQNYESSGINCKVQWDKLSCVDLHHYHTSSEQNLLSIVTDVTLLNCKDVTCSDPLHIAAINNLYDNIVSALLGAELELGSNHNNNNNKKRYTQVPGWTDHCKDAHTDARVAFLQWRASGSPKQGPSFNIMTGTRARFKLMLRKCKLNNDVMVADAIAKKFLLKNSKSF
jgi:hypothetical protein